MNIRFFSGQALFEIIIALGVIAIILVGVVPLATTSVRNSSFSNNNAQATKYVQEAVEWLRRERDRNWNDFVQKGQVSGSYCLVSTDWSRPGPCLSTDFISGTTIFLREVNLSCFVDSPSQSTQCSDPLVKGVKAEVKVWWQDAQAIREVRSVNYFTYWNP